MAQNDRPVWMSCDVSRNLYDKQDVWDENIYAYASIFGFGIELTKS